MQNIDNQFAKIPFMLQTNLQMHSILIKMFLVLGIALLNISNTPPPSQNPCNIMFPRYGNDDWGNGMYLLPDDSNITVYKNKKGQKFGKLSKVNSYFRFWDNNDKRQRLKYGDIEYIGHYSMSFLKIRGISNDDYVQVFWNSFDEGMYVKKSELTAQKAKFFTYRKLLYSKNIPIDVEEFRNWASLGVNLNNNCLNLRKGPSTNDGIIRCISGNHESRKQFSHLSIIETKEDWAKVEVVKYVLTDAAESECDYSEHSKEIGWIKAVDDNGFPNVWYSVTRY